MARYLSPQVVINEIDVSAIAEEAFGTPFLMLGETQIGRDDRPVTVTTKANFARMFGGTVPDYPSTYAAFEYLSFGNQLQFKRVTSTKFVKVLNQTTLQMFEDFSESVLIPRVGFPATPTVPPIAALGAASLLPETGLRSYKVTFVTATGETVATAASNTVDTLGASSVDLTDIPVGPASVIARNIYRTVGGGAIWYLLDTIADNSTTTYNDIITDAGLNLNPVEPAEATGDTVTVTYGYGVGELTPVPVFMIPVDTNPDPFLISNLTAGVAAPHPSKWTSGAATNPDQTSRAFMIKDQTGGIAPFKMWLTDWLGEYDDGVDTWEVYQITWDSYGIDYESLGTFPLSFEADVYVSHAEPAFVQDVRLFKDPLSAVPAETNYTFDADERSAYGSGVPANARLDAVSYYVTDYTDAGYGPYTDLDIASGLVPVPGPPPTGAILTIVDSPLTPGVSVLATTSAAHGMTVGQTVTIAGAIVDPGYNGAWVITLVPNPDEFEFAYVWTVDEGAGATWTGPVPPAVPEFPAGAYDYRFTFVTSAGVESAASKLTTFTTGAGFDTFEITCPGIPTGYRGVYIYRNYLGEYHRVNTTVHTDEAVTITDSVLNITANTELANCPVEVSLNGVAVTPPNPRFLHMVDLDVDGTVEGEYIYEVFGGTNQYSTWIRGDSPDLKVGRALYKVIKVSTDADKYPNTMSYLENPTDLTKIGRYYYSVFIENTTGNHLFFFRGESTYPVPDTEIFRAYMYILNTKYYYYPESEFDRYAALAKGRGSWMNGYYVLASYNRIINEHEILIFSSAGELLERWTEIEKKDLVDKVSEFSDYVSLINLPDFADPTAIAIFDPNTSGIIESTAFYKSLFYGGYDGYFDIDESDFVANIDMGVAGAKYAVDPSYSDLVATSQMVQTFDGSLDYTVLCIPGWSAVPTLAGKMTDTVESRKFAAAIIDLPANLDPNSAVLYRNTEMAHIASSHVGLYWNYGKIYDADNEIYVWLPPTVAATRAIVYTLNQAEPWKAPAGLNRGRVPEFIDLEFFPTLGDRDNLYSVQINPIAKITNQIVVWGNKTAQRYRSMLSNFHVRLLLIAAEKAAFLTSQQFLFEPNDKIERTRLILTLQPVFDRYRQQRGILKFGMFDITTDQDMAENVAHFRIELQPTPSMEVIIHDFVIKSPAQAITGTT